MSEVLQLSGAGPEDQVSRTRWCLAAGIHMTAVDEDLVLLSIPADTYLCLPGGGRRVLRGPDSNAVTVSDPAIAAELAAGGLIEMARPRAMSMRPWSGHPTASALPTRGAFPCPRDLGEAAASLFDLFVHYRGHALGDLVQLARAGAPAPSDAPPDEGLLEVVANFHRWSPYAPISGKCLLRSFLLLRLLQRRGYGARWVFGVSTWPFKAHCWLQCGATVLDDTFERLWSYQPILVV
jgi:hypothetical protein